MGAVISFQPGLSNYIALLIMRESIAHFRQQRFELRGEWVRGMTNAKMLTAMSKEELFVEAISIYDNYIDALGTGNFEALQVYTRDLSSRIIHRGFETDEVTGIVLLLRDVLARSLFEKYKTDFKLLNCILDAYEPAANCIATAVAVVLAQERERIIRQQQEDKHELSIPALLIREGLLIFPAAGVIDTQRANQLSEQLLHGIRANRARVVVIDLTGLAVIDSLAANHLIVIVEASRLLGATVIVTGLSPAIAKSLVNNGVDLRKINKVSDLQAGIQEAERLLRYMVVPKADKKASVMASCK